MIFDNRVYNEDNIAGESGMRRYIINMMIKDTVNIGSRVGIECYVARKEPLIKMNCASHTNI